MIFWEVLYLRQEEVGREEDSGGEKEIGFKVQSRPGGRNGLTLLRPKGTGREGRGRDDRGLNKKPSVPPDANRSPNKAERLEGDALTTGLRSVGGQMKGNYKRREKDQGVMIGTLKRHDLENLQRRIRTSRWFGRKKRSAAMGKQISSWWSSTLTRKGRVNRRESSVSPIGCEN